MPDQLIRDSIIRMLKETDYRSGKICEKGRPAYLLKNYITSMDDDIVIVGENIFEVVIDDNDYNEILFAEAKHSIIKINRQYDAVKAIAKDNALPKAWLLVSAYYHSFYCANFISRLLGRYSSYFDGKEIINITKSATNTSRSKLAHGNYVGYFDTNTSNCVKIKFKFEGDKPHHIAWKNLYSKITMSDLTGNVDANRLNRINLFRKIINENCRAWPQPSEVRNKWNYSEVSLYSERGDSVAQELPYFIDNTRDITWASNKNLYPDDKNISNSIGFLSSTLNRAVMACEAKLLG